MQLRADNVTVIRSGRTLVSGFSLDVSDGELVGLIGPNGAGKSTLLSVLAGLSTCDSGQVFLDDTPIAYQRDRSKILAWVEQSGPVNWPLTVERIVTLGRRPHLGAWHRPGDADISAIERAITDTDCTNIRHQDATTLSGGERTRMMLARALAAEPEILLADEPVAALDLGHQIQTMELLRRFSSQRQSCVVVLHDLSLAARYCDRLYLMDQGKAVAHGSPGAVLSHANLRAVYGVEVAVGCDEVPWIVPLRQVDPSI